MDAMNPNPRLHALLEQLDRAFRRRSWHGPNLLGSLRRLDARSAAWRPHPDRHNAWEIVVHAAYWKYRLCRLLAADPPASFSFPGSDWWVRPGDGSEPTADSWREDQQLLQEWHENLVRAVERFDPDRLDDDATSEWSYFDLIAGGAAHDLYHAGQIQLLKRMQDG